MAHGRFLISQQESVSSRAAYWRSTVDSVDATDERQVVFRLKQADPDFDWVVSAGVDLLIPSKAQWDKEGKEGMGRRPVGTGPYQYVSHAVGRNYVFEAVPYKHWRQTPDFKVLEMRWANEDATRLAMLLSGEVQVAQLPNDL